MSEYDLPSQREYGVRAYWANLRRRQPKEFKETVKGMTIYQTIEKKSDPDLIGAVTGNYDSTNPDVTGLSVRFIKVER